MIKVGITGGIGSGKSTVCKVFQMLGVPVYDSDTEAKNLLNEDAIKDQIVAVFGKDVLNSLGGIDRKELAKHSFSDKVKLEQLNAIVHPAVGKHFEDWCKKQEGASYILKEAAILFESGANKQVDKVIMVAAPLELKRFRAMLRDGISEDEFEKRRKNQWEDERKEKLSDFIIHNDEQQFLIPQVVELDKVLKGL